MAIVEAKLQKAKAKAKVQQAQAELNFATVRAPFDGIVGRMSHHQGSLVEEGENLTTLSDNSFLSVYFNVPEARYLKFVIENGVGVDDKIVLEGFRQLRDGDKVQYENRYREQVPANLKYDAKWQPLPRPAGNNSSCCCSALSIRHSVSLQ